MEEKKWVRWLPVHRRRLSNTAVFTFCKCKKQLELSEVNEVGWRWRDKPVGKHGKLDAVSNFRLAYVGGSGGGALKHDADITRILLNWSNEGADERGQVVEVLYDQLRQNAANQLRHESNVELQPTSLVNEAYIKLVKISRIDLKSRSHFLGLAGRIMRQILVDDARKRRSLKRDQALQTRLTGDYIDSQLPVTDLLELDELLSNLEQLDPVYVQIFEARIFAGMTISETAQAYDMSPSSVKRKWKLTLAWMRVRMNDAGTSIDQAGATIGVGV